MNELPMFLTHLKRPEYLHLLLNPLPIYGMAAGAFMLLVCLLKRQETFAPLLWICVMGAATWAVFEFGEHGYDRIREMSGTDARQWLEVHMERAEKSMALFFITGASSLAALVTKKRWPAVSKNLVLGTLVLAVLSSMAGGWIGHAGGQVRHSEFREGPPAPSSSQKEDLSH